MVVNSEVLLPAAAADHFGRHASHDRAATPDNPRMLIGPLEIRYIAPTVGNAHKKAGALNQILDRALPLLQAGDAVLVMDADSAIDKRFSEVAISRLGTHESFRSSRKMIGGVGGTFRGGRGGGFVGMLQRNEYARDVRRLRGRALVLTGTAAIFRVDVLRRVVHARAEGLLPGDQAWVYDTNVLTEDNELTLALLHLGYAIVSPQECLLETEVMPTGGRYGTSGCAGSAGRSRT